MLWACLHFFDLPLQSVFAADELAQPCAVSAGPRQRPLIVQANRAARAHGVRRTQPVAAARALCAALLTRTRDEAAEAQRLRSLAAWAYRYSSQVSLDGDALLVEIGASLRLFGGRDALLARLRGDLTGLGLAPRFAAAPLARAARALALHRDGLWAGDRAAMRGALDALPIQRCLLAPQAVALLHDVGLRTLRDVLALPRAELARRIGPDQLAALDLLHGAVRETRLLYRPPDRFDHRLEFEARIEAWPALLFPLRRLCDDLALFLAARDGGVQRCELVLEHEDRAASIVDVELLTPQREARALHELIRHRLERTRLPAAVAGMALRARDLPTLRPRHADLFDTRRAQSLEWPDLAERLRARLGDDAVHRLAVVADHRPELAWGFAPAADAATAARRQGKASADVDATTAPTPAAPRPLWLLREARPLNAGAHAILAGPERIESGWWDGGDTRRDYYVMRLASGQRAWVFRCRDAAADDWMLHGWFA